MADSSDNAKTQRSARSRHRKTRTGCQNCRDRRVKCDEARPTCANCTRLALGCIYGYVKPLAARRAKAHHHPGSPNWRDDGNLDPDGTVHFPETEARRRLELELMYHYVTDTGSSISVDPGANPFWSKFLCEAAFQSDAVMFCVLFMSAFHKAWQLGDAGAEYAQHGSVYLSMALRAHHMDVAQLSAANVDFACLASSAFRIYDFIRLQQRPLDPYSPPIDWLRMTGASHVVFLRALGLADGNPDSFGSRMVQSVEPVLDDKNNLRHTNELTHLLRRQEPHELAEPWDDEIYRTYTSTLSCIGSVWEMRHQQHLPYCLYRRLIIFPIIIDDSFVDLVAERRPRTLVILAHYFALLIMLRRLWFVGDSGFREVWAIAAQLPPEWQGMMREPLEMVKHPSAVADAMLDRDV